MTMEFKSRGLGWHYRVTGYALNKELHALKLNIAYISDIYNWDRQSLLL